MLGGLPAELVARVLGHVGALRLPDTLLALQLTCHSWRCAFRDEALWVELESWISNPSASGATRTKSPSRRSERLALTTSGRFAQAYTALRVRGEAMHHAVACHGQDAKDLSVAKLRRLYRHYGPVLLNRVSPVYYATVLMEVARAKVGEDSP